MSKVKTFLELCVATITGDDAEAKSLKIQLKAQAALESNIPSLEGDIVDFKEEISDAELALEQARINGGELISDRKVYIENLIKAQNRLTVAVEKLNAHKAKITFLKGQLKLVKGKPAND